MKFSGTLNLANLVNLKTHFLNVESPPVSNNPILAMIREREGHKTFFVYVRTVEIAHRSLVALIFRLIYLSYSQEKASKV